MPLLTSPIDGSPMRQINRYGIEIDVCPTSGGIWLDKGEIEKLMAIIKEEATGGQSPIMHGSQPREDHYGHAKYHRDYDDDDDRYEKDYRYSRKKSKFSRIADIFDF